MKYIVIELQTNSDGTVGNLVYAFDDIQSAESKYHAVLAVAALTTLPMHACALLQSDGKMLARQAYCKPVEEEEQNNISEF